jgi:hypothetical protein
MCLNKDLKKLTLNLRIINHHLRKQSVKFACSDYEILGNWINFILNIIYIPDRRVTAEIIYCTILELLNAAIFHRRSPVLSVNFFRCQ